MAQLVEQLIRNQQVAGSNPAISSKKARFSSILSKKYFEKRVFFFLFRTNMLPKCQNLVSKSIFKYVANYF